MHTGEAEGKVARINEISGTVESRIEVGGKPKGLAVGSDSVWVVDCHIDRRRVIRIPLGSGTQTSMPVDGYPVLWRWTAGACTSRCAAANRSAARLRGPMPKPYLFCCISVIMQRT